MCSKENSNNYNRNIDVYLQSKSIKTSFSSKILSNINDNNSSNIKLIIELFNLPVNSQVYDDFGCSYSDGILYHGRMYLTKYFLCFNSNVFGMVKKFKLKVKDIIKISKKRILLIDGAIEITSNEKELSKNKDGKFVFGSFSNRDTVLNRLKYTIKKNSTYNKKESIISSHSSNISSDTNNNYNSNIKESISKEYNNLLPTNLNYDNTEVNSETNHTNKSISKLDNSNIKDTSKFFKNKIDNKSNVEDKNALINDIEELNQSKYLYLNDEDILLEDYIKRIEDNSCIEIPSFIIEYSINDMYSHIFKDHSKCSFVNYNEFNQRTNQKISSWEEVECTSENYLNAFKDLRNYVINKNLINNKAIDNINFPNINNNKILQNIDNNYNNVINYNPIQVSAIKNIKVRQFNFVTKVKGLPTVSSTRVEKYQKIENIIDNNNNIYGFNFYSSNRSLDTPYSDYFTVDEKWEIHAFEINKCLVRITFIVCFEKSALLRGVIEKRVKQDFISEVNQIKDYFKQNNIILYDFKSSMKLTKKKEQGSLKHGLSCEKQDNVLKKDCNNTNNIAIILNNSKSILIKAKEIFDKFILDNEYTYKYYKDALFIVIICFLMYNMIILNYKIEKLQKDLNLFVENKY